jgi:type II secretory pathway pseudopilin PulG
VLLAVLFMVALILIGLAVAAPKVAQDIQRDKEAELYHRGLQYARAIRLYYRKMGNYPTDLSQLENTNNLRFLRKRYVDPITGQPFRIIHQGEAKAPLLGLFGQPLAVQPIGTTPTGNPIGTPIAGSQDGTTTGTSLFANSTGSSTAATPSYGSTSPGTSTGLSGGVTGTSSGFGTSPGSGTTTGFGSSPGSGTGTGFGTTAVGPIVGVSSTSPKQSIRVYKKQTHYNQWEFVYDPNAEALGGGGIPQGGINGQSGLNGPGTTTNTPGTTTNPAQGTIGVQMTPPTSAPTTPTAPQ